MSRPHPPLRALLFDKDDTLIELAPFWRAPVHKLARWLAGACHCAGDAALIAKLEAAAGFENGRLLPESPVVAGTNADVLAACLSVAAQSGRALPPHLAAQGADYLASACLQYGTVQSREPLLPYFAGWKDRGYRIGVATSDDYAPTLHCLQKLGLAPYFDAILSADQVAHPKPAPDMALEFCRRCGVAPAQTAMVGDSDNDMRFAQNSGLTGILYRAPLPKTLPSGAALGVASFAELDRFLDADS